MNNLGVHGLSLCRRSARAGDDATLFRRWMDGEPYAARMMWQRFAPMVHRR